MYKYDVYRRQIPMYKYGPRTKRVKYPGDDISHWNT